jgi:hypothetical protein
MGYLITQQLHKQVIIIPEADVQIMNSAQTPYTLITTNNSFFVIPVVCYVQINANQTTPYTGFTHLHLSNGGNYGVPEICATFAENASSNNLSTGFIYGLSINLQSSPTRIGGFLGNKDLQIYFDTPITSGDGDMTVTIYYFTL